MEAEKSEHSALAVEDDSEYMMLSSTLIALKQQDGKEGAAAAEQPQPPPYHTVFSAMERRPRSLSDSTAPAPRDRRSWQPCLETIKEEDEPEGYMRDHTHFTIKEGDEPEGFLQDRTHYNRDFVKMLRFLAVICAMLAWETYCYVEDPEGRLNLVGTTLVLTLVAFVVPSLDDSDPTNGAIARGVVLFVVWYTAICLARADTMP